MLQTNKCRHEFNRSSSKVSEVMRMFTNRNNINAVGAGNGSFCNAQGEEKSVQNKIKRSDSYKLANSPLLPIKKLLKLDTFSSNPKK